MEKLKQCYFLQKADNKSVTREFNEKSKIEIQ